MNKIFKMWEKLCSWKIYATLSTHWTSTSVTFCTPLLDPDLCFFVPRMESSNIHFCTRRQIYSRTDLWYILIFPTAHHTQPRRTPTVSCRLWKQSIGGTWPWPVQHSSSIWRLRWRWSRKAASGRAGVENKPCQSCWHEQAQRWNKTESTEEAGWGRK